MDNFCSCFYMSSHEKLLLSRLLELVNGILDSVRNYLKSKKSDKENQGGRKDGKKKKVLSMFCNVIQLTLTILNLPHFNFNSMDSKNLATEL